LQTKKNHLAVVFFRNKRVITWKLPKQELLREQQMRQRLRVQQQEREQQQERLLPFYRKRPKQQQR
jgi:hypothetical protein